MGKTTATLQALPTAPLHYRALQFLMNLVAPVNYIQEGTTDKFNTIVQLDPESKADLTWWSSLNRKDLSTPVIPPAPLLTIESDASNKGWGAVLERQTQTGGVWTAEEATHHINYLELLAAFLVIKAFGKDWRDTAVLLRMDNITAVSYVNHKGSTTSLKLCKLAITMWTWCTSRNITLTAEHLPGHLNVTADQESWLVRDRCDWMLNPHVFQKIQESMGPLEVDLFASRLTRQLPHFYSWRADPEAAATDAFMQDWSHLRGFANPPWCLISRCLSKVKAEGARIVLVTPLWNTQPWFPVVLELLEDYPRRLVNQPDLVVLPVGQEFLMKQGVPQLIAWLISGNLTHHKAFLQRLQTSCLPHGEIKPILTMRDKTNSNYGSSFAKWASWCQQRGTNPLSGPVADVVNFLAALFSTNPLSGPLADVVNFLAALFSQGYQYQSLNCYRSAISSVHEKVDDNSIGIHPAVTRLLKGAFHTRPSQPRYSSFWDVGAVISYLRNLGGNDSLNLRHLTLKTVMLLPLTRPSRSADLAKLDIQWMSYQADGVTFQPAHLAKQSRSSKHLADFSFLCSRMTLSYALS